MRCHGVSCNRKRRGVAGASIVLDAGRIPVETMPSKHGKGWRARWVDQHGERHSQTFTYKRDAEAFEHRKKAEAEEVRHGLRAERPASHSFGELCDYWIENRASRKRSKAPR